MHCEIRAKNTFSHGSPKFIITFYSLPITLPTASQENDEHCIKDFLKTTHSIFYRARAWEFK